MTAPNLRQLGGRQATTIPGLVRAIFDLYAKIAIKEGVAAPKIRFGKRYVEQVDAPPRIVIVPRPGPWGGLDQGGAGQVASMMPTLNVHIWGIEPTFVDDELENELNRYDAADPLLARFHNVLKRVASGRIEPLDVDPNAGQEEGEATVNKHGETYVLSFRFTQDITKDEIVWGVLPDLDSGGLPTPQLSPAPTYNVAFVDAEFTVITNAQEP